MATATVVIAFTLAGCASGPGSPSATTDAAASASPTPSATPTPTPTVDWVSYQTPDQSAAWELPAGWSVLVGSTTSYATGLDVPTYTILDPDGVARIRLDVQIGGIGGPGCEVMSPLYPYALLDTADPASAPGHIWFESVDAPAGVVTELQLVPPDAVSPTEACGTDWGFVPTESLGIISWRALQPLPDPVDQAADPDAYAALPTDEAGAVISFATAADAEAFMDTELYQTLRRILSSLDIAAG
ncbi:hypothetical protein [Microbacterium pumilum]|uniref:Uncharacterized protein n=1 Tax=Microbacterium pumilum TaxID=344165 RepID=A0ABN2SXS8_9MICO